MSARLSKEVTDRVRAGRYLLSAFEIEGSRVASSFLDTTGPHLEDGDAEPRPQGFLTAIERTLRHGVDELVETDHAVAAAAGRESVLRQRHRSKKRRLAFQIVALRRMVLGQYADPDLPNLGLEPVNVRDGVTVLRRAELIAQRFEAANLSRLLGAPRFEGPLELRGCAAEIRAGAVELLALSDSIDEARRAVDRARIERNRAKDAYDRTYLRAARMFEDLCRFCGLDDLAARVRRREARPARDAEETPEDLLEGKADAPKSAEISGESPERGTVRTRAAQRLPPAGSGPAGIFLEESPVKTPRSEPGRAGARASPGRAAPPPDLRSG